MPTAAERPATPAVVVWAGYLFSGVAAVLTAVTLGCLFAIPLTGHHRGHPGAGPLIAVALAAVVIAAVVVRLAMLTGRGGTITRWATRALCGLAVAGGLSVAVIGPTLGVPALGGPLRVAAVAAGVLAAAAATLPALPGANAHFRPARRIGAPPLPTAAPVSAPGPAVPAYQDRDPFA